MSVSSDDGEPVADWRESTPCAVKAHRCDACRETIRPGDVYAREDYVFEGERQSTKRCARCHTMYLALRKLHLEEPTEEGDGVDPYLNCGHDFREVFGKEPPPELARLAFLTPDEMQAELERPKP